MDDHPLWTPSAQRVAAANLTRFVASAAARWGRAFSDYPSLHHWSITHREEFWTSVWDYCEVAGDRGDTVLTHGERMPGAVWFAQARLNFAQNLLRRRDDAVAIVFRGESEISTRISYAELYRHTARMTAAMRAEGIKAGDRIAAYLPNIPDTVVVMLAAAAIGAVFTSASPDFGVQGVLDRFGQIEPSLLFVADAYRYSGKIVETLTKTAEIVQRLPSLRRTIVVPHVRDDILTAGLSSIRNAITLQDFVSPHTAQSEVEFAALPFNHPLYILYSSGTTGVPKCIVHGAGGVLLQHLKEHRLHGDIKPGDRLFYFTTCGWMMWNWLVSGLASGATLILYDGSPMQNDGRVLFDYAETEGITHFGISAKFVDAIAKNGLKPSQTHHLAQLRTIFSTGSPLVPEAFDYVYANIKRDVQLASMSGGTDIVSCFVMGNPVAPVHRGEIQCAALGMAVDVFDERGHALRGEKGELVCTRAFPVMPLYFWNDPGDKKYRAAYFERYENIWCHGDFAQRTAHDGFVIHGRSDATLNPGGVRIGTAEIYRQVEKLPEVVESLVIGQNWDNDVRIVLFVRLRDNQTLDDALTRRIQQVIRDHATPRHVPKKVLQVNDIPRTKSGKIVELAVRNVVHGEPVRNVEALANPEALEHFRNRPELAV
jgi:acetoacetyl-CoA synthetase